LRELRRPAAGHTGRRLPRRILRRLLLEPDAGAGGSGHDEHGLDGRPYRGGLHGEGLALRPGTRLRRRRRADRHRAAPSLAAPDAECPPQLTRRSDQFAAERRELPWVPIEKRRHDQYDTQTSQPGTAKRTVPHGAQTDNSATAWQLTAETRNARQIGGSGALWSRAAATGAT